MTDLIKELKALKEKVGLGMVRVSTNCPDLAVALVNHLPTILAKLEEGKRMREALDGLIDAVTKEVNSPDHRGGSGFLLARLSDARRALAGSAT